MGPLHISEKENERISLPDPKNVTPQNKHQTVWLWHVVTPNIIFNLRTLHIENPFPQNPVCKSRSWSSTLEPSIRHVKAYQRVPIFNHHKQTNNISTYESFEGTPTLKKKNNCYFSFGGPILLYCFGHCEVVNFGKSFECKF